MQKKQNLETKSLEKHSMIPCLKTEPTLVLDLDETLVHSSPRPSPTSSLKFTYVKIPVESFVLISGVLIFRRFLNVSKIISRVIFTTNRNRYADKVIDRIDTGGDVSTRFYRQDCTPLRLEGSGKIYVC